MTKILSSILLAVLTLAPLKASADQCVVPKVLIVLDKSSSMTNQTDGHTLWYWATDAISNLTNTYEGLIDFGLMVYPGVDKCTPGEVKVDCGPANATPIIMELADPPPSGGNYTPMYQSLDVAATYAPLLDSTSNNYVIFLTDGWQWCDPYDATERFYSVDSVATLNSLGIKTAVIGFSGSTDVTALHRMAIEGDMTTTSCDPTASTIDDNNRCNFQTDDGPSLDAVLNAIALEITAEICDGIDNNCDGNIDEGLFQSCSSDCGSGIEQCVNGIWGGCTAEEPKLEVCDDIDNNCDGVVDEGCSCLNGATKECGLDIGSCTQGYQHCENGIWTECRDAVWPTEETCNNVDDDCNGFIDENITETCSSICGVGVRECVGGSWSNCSAPTPTQEICNAQDDNCDGTIDEGDNLCDVGFECLEGVCVDQNGNLPDAGTDTDTDTGDELPGSANAPDGCNCTTPAGSGSSKLPLFALFAMLFIIIRKKL
jgi:Putative metal-binding motif